jgi:protein SCO1/2
MTRRAHAKAFTLAVCALVGALVFSVQSGAAAERLDPSKALQRSEAAIGRTLGAYKLTDSTGAPLALRAFRGKPLVISLVYTACSSICPTSTQHLITAVTDARRVLGSDRFNVLTIGFDARNDTPARLTQFASAQGIAGPGWRLASADAATIEALLRDLGFSYATIAGGFDHVTQTTLVDADGKIYRHVYGDDFPLTMFVEPLKDLIYGTTTSFTFKGMIDHIKFICTTFDPGAGRYRIDYGLMFGSVIGAFSLIVFGAILLREWRRAGGGSAKSTLHLSSSRRGRIPSAREESG